MIENDPSDPAVPDPIDSSPLRSSTVLPASAVPSIVGEDSFVNSVVVVITGALGGVVSISTINPADASDSFPAASVALTVSV